jgi:enterochelin esterase family protein
MTSSFAPLLALMLTFVLSAAPATQNAPLTPKSLEMALVGNPSEMAGAEAETLAAAVRALIGPDIPNHAKAPAPKVDELSVAWGLEIPNLSSAPKVISDDGRYAFTLTRIGKTNVYAAVKNFNWGEAFRWHYEIDGRKFVAGNGQLEVYTTPPESKEQPNAPHGKVVQMPKWTSKIFEGTTRDWWVYIPAQYQAESPACVMVFQDGQGPKNYMPVIFDNMIAKGEIPVTIGVFIPPGVKADGKPNRSFEYDTLSDQYARFILEEMLPEVEKSYKLRHDTASRAIAGISSGAICAWTVAWERPNEFSKVLSWVGSFTNIAAGPTVRAGGHNYEAMIRKTPRKPIRIFMQDGENDLDNANGNWPLANQTLSKSLAFAGYDYRFEFGHGFHSDKHGRAILPDSLRWLWRDYKIEK